MTCKENGYLYYDEWDLTIKDIWIQNIGDKKSEATKVCIYLSKDWDFKDNDNILLETLDLEALEPNETGALDVFIEMMNLDVDIPYGRYYVAVVLDCGDYVEESDEHNNICVYNQRIKVEPPKQADLTCLDLGHMKANFWDIFITGAKVKNIGWAKSEATKVCVYVSTDKDFGSYDDYLVAELPLKALNPYGTATLNATIQLMDFDIPYGEYYIGLVIDCDDYVDESDENNNVCYYSEKVYLEPAAQPDLTCKETGELVISQVPAPGPGGNGNYNGGYKDDELSLTFKNLVVANIGNGSSSPAEVSVYLSLDETFGDADDHFVGDLSIPTIGPDGTHTINKALNLNTKDLPDGSYYVGFVIDSKDEVAESDEGNNQCYYTDTKVNHNYTPPLDCACADATWEKLCESFEKYTTDKMLSEQSECWSTWTEKAYPDFPALPFENALVATDQGMQDSKCLMIDQLGQNLLLSLGDRGGEIFRMSWMMKIPKESMGYVGLIKTENISEQNNHALQFTFGTETEGKGKIEELRQTFDYPVGEWFEVEIIFDLRRYNILSWAKVNGQLAANYKFFNSNVLGALNFATLAEEYKFMVDNIVVERLNKVPPHNSTPTGPGTSPGAAPGVGLNAANAANPANTADEQATALSQDRPAEDASKGHSLKQYVVYPNPTSGIFRIDLSLNRTEDVEVFILNTMGQVIRRIRFDQVDQLQENIDLGNEPGGLYLIRTQVGEEFYDTRLLLEK